MKSMIRVAVMMSVICSLAGNSFAKKPEPVIRTFAYLAGVGNQNPIPDFLSEDSITVTVLPKAIYPVEQTIQIVVDNDDGTQSITNWHRHPAHYATSDGVKYLGFFLWLETSHPATQSPPPSGSHTFTGPDGLILAAEPPVGLKLCATGSGCPSGTNGNAFHFVPVGANAFTFVIVEALFSK